MYMLYELTPVGAYANCRVLVHSPMLVASLQVSRRFIESRLLLHHLIKRCSAENRHTKTALVDQKIAWSVGLGKSRFPSAQISPSRTCNSSPTALYHDPIEISVREDHLVSLVLRRPCSFRTRSSMQGAVDKWIAAGMDWKYQPKCRSCSYSDQREHRAPTSSVDRMHVPTGLAVH